MQFNIVSLKRKNPCRLAMSPSVASVLHSTLQTGMCAKSSRNKTLCDITATQVCVEPPGTALWPPSCCAIVSLWKTQQRIVFIWMLFSGDLGHFLHNLTV